MWVEASARGRRSHLPPQLWVARAPTVMPHSETLRRPLASATVDKGMVHPVAAWVAASSEALQPVATVKDHPAGISGAARVVAARTAASLETTQWAAVDRDVGNQVSVRGSAAWDSAAVALACNRTEG